MPSTSRRRFLAAVGASGLAAAAGCSALGGGRPDVTTGSGLGADASHALDDETVYVAGGESDLPEPPETAASVEDADAVLATPDADRVAVVRALRAGKPVALAGGDPALAVRGALEAAGGRTFGVESVRARPVPVAVAVPRGETVETFTVVDDGGWSRPVLDPFGWALTGRVPDCQTFVPESSADDEYAYAGAAHVVGRLGSGEAYASRSVASVARRDAGTFVRLRTTLHAEADDGYAVELAEREADFPDDQRLHRTWPNPHTRSGVRVANVSDATRSTFAVEAEPASDRARSALTACGGLRTEGRLAYDHRTAFRWQRDGLLSPDRHYGSATGRGEWVLDP
ncbi:hypothetical protein [Halobacterium yunchengense]|uniref:hypothetical protein n=1 Tax=Halobacterium yunchengense TaxID=3108497 RepID=UPI00300AA51B